MYRLVLNCYNHEPLLDTHTKWLITILSLTDRYLATVFSVFLEFTDLFLLLCHRYGNNLSILIYCKIIFEKERFHKDLVILIICLFSVIVKLNKTFHQL